MNSQPASSFWAFPATENDWPVAGKLCITRFQFLFDQQVHYYHSEPQSNNDRSKSETKPIAMGRVSDAKEKLMKAVTELIWTGSYGSTTIDQICERAGVKKGSFYYFFDSKATLAGEAIEAAWEEYRPKLDKVFSPSLPPLERIHRFCEFEYQEQCELHRQFGHVLGCPLCTLGAEISTQEDILRGKVQAIMDQSRKYLETTIRDAHAEGSIRAHDAAAKARTVYAYTEGLMTQARIRNDVELFREMERGILDLLGVKELEAVVV